jgi:hypothetical protein
LGLLDPDSSVAMDDEVGVESVVDNASGEGELVVVLEEVVLAGVVVVEVGESTVFVFIGPPTEVVD